MAVNGQAAWRAGPGELVTSVPERPCAGASACDGSKQRIGDDWIAKGFEMARVGGQLAADDLRFRGFPTIARTRPRNRTSEPANNQQTSRPANQSVAARV